jgi:hypothetical protein
LEGAVVAELRFFPGIFVDGLRRITENRIADVPAEIRIQVVNFAARPTCSVPHVWFDYQQRIGEGSEAVLVTGYGGP